MIYRPMRCLFSMIFLVCMVWHSVTLASVVTKVPILTYHNFDPTIPGSMTIKTQKFAAQLKWLKANGYTVIPLQQLVAYLLGKNITLPVKPVVIVVDDGRKTVYTEMLPLVLEYKIPVTLFVYPSSISNAAYALTWKQLKELQSTGLFDIQSHTYWHPNFNQEKKNLTVNAYHQLVHNQLVTSKKVLEDKLGTRITLLAWPYGIYNKYLEQAAAKTGYIMAFSIDDRKASRLERRMSQPRYMVRDSYGMKAFASLVNDKKPMKNQVTHVANHKTQ